MSVYAELISAVTPLGFRAAMKGESDSDHLGRLALAASAMPDYEWSCLTAEAVEWVNASAKRLNLGKTVGSCSGFKDAQRSYIGEDGTLWTPVEKDSDAYAAEQARLEALPPWLGARDSIEGMGIAPGGHIGADGKLVITEFSIVDPAQLRDPHCVIGKRHVSSQVQAENIALDTSNADSSEDDPHGEMPAAGYPKAELTSGFLAYKPGESEKEALVRLAQSGFRAPCVLGKTDAIRALVMQHPEWTEEQLKAAGGDDVTRATLKTVRSVTLATIAVAKRLGLWREA